jgi:lysosomal acid lipase/cholesteryl ester hydrolase
MQMDEFAWHDIPDSISYILNVTRAPSVGYVGFSQGTAQAFAALAVNPTLNAQVSVFVALAPALAPPGLAAPVVDGLMKASPALLFLLFGRKAIMASALAWQRLLYPPIFARLIDISLGFLFRWYGARIGAAQKHWFQIMRAQAFAPFDDDVAATGAALSLSRHDMRARPSVPMRFPTRNIATPIVLLWGDADSLVDINAMRAQLPEAARDRRLRGYEHLDILWGDDVHRDVIPHVLEELRRHAGPAKPAGMVNGVERTGAAA